MSRTFTASFVIGAIAAAATGFAAVAADLPRRTIAPAPFHSPLPPTFTWTGFYAGVHAGWIGQDRSATRRGFNGFGAANAAVTAAFPARLGSRNESGFIGGGQIGYNQDFGGVVVGAEADLSALGSRSSTTTSGALGAPVAGFRAQTSSGMDWLGTARLRVGYALDRALLYGTGGVAMGHVDQRVSVINGAGVVTHTGREKDTRVGWALGGGAEYAFTDNLTARGEWLYYNLGRNNVRARATPAGPAGTSGGYRFESRGHILRAGVNYKF